MIKFKLEPNGPKRPYEKYKPHVFRIFSLFSSPSPPSIKIHEHVCYAVSKGQNLLHLLNVGHFTYLKSSLMITKIDSVTNVWEKLHVKIYLVVVFVISIVT